MNMADSNVASSKPSVVSFGFSKKREIRKIDIAKVISGESHRVDEETDYVTSLEGKEVKS